MSRILVTGAAGFIGSRVVEKLLEAGEHVIGLDSFDETLNSAKTRRVFVNNLKKHKGNFKFIEDSLVTIQIEPLIRDLDCIVHLAATPGLMPSWKSFDKYLQNNVQGTFRLAKALLDSGKSCKVLHASTSSVYGANAVGSESVTPNPVSPYGITKLASEHIWNSFFPNPSIPITILRYFSVYGPRQREDMAWQKFIRLIMDDKPITLTGSIGHTRTFTFIDDIADITAKLASGLPSQGIYNIAGGEEINLLEGINLVGEILSKKVNLNFAPPRPGDQIKTSADCTRAKKELNFSPKVRFDEGIRRQITYISTES